MGKKKVVLDQFDFIRAIACLGIVLYHFAVEYGWPDIFNNYVGGVTYGVVKNADKIPVIQNFVEENDAPVVKVAEKPKEKEKN